MMQVQVNTDSSINATIDLVAEVETIVRQALEHFEERATRIEVHLSDENGPKGGDADKRCTIEARLAGREPIAVSQMGDTIIQAVNGAADVMKRTLKKDLAKLNDRRTAGGPTFS